MRTSMKLISVLFMVLIFGMANFVLAQKAGEAWVVPDKYKTMKSTIKVTDASVMTTGKELYNKHCKSCHGSKGLGDGPKSATLKTIVPSFKDQKFQAQTDGVIYYQTFIGRDEMPNFEKKIPDEGDRWAIVNFVRTLK